LHPGAAAAPIPVFEEKTGLFPSAAPDGANQSAFRVGGLDQGAKNPLRVNFNLRWDFNVIWVVQSL
jgi:hypothetical protein